MQKRFTDRQRILLSLGWVCAFALLAPGGASAVESAARVTVSVGTALSGDEALEPRAALGEGADLETGDDGNCSLLVDEDALVELCGSTSLRLERKGGLPEGARVVRLERGEIRMVVEPRLGEERIEIHTPAAIATILGTVVHVSVDALGVTTFTAVANEMLVENADPSVVGSRRVRPGQQLVMAPGKLPPPPATSVSPQVLASLGGCLIDFHEVSLHADRMTRASEKLEEIINEEIAEGERPPVGAEAELAFADIVVEESPVDDPEPPYEPTDTEPPYEPPDGNGEPEPPVFIDPPGTFPEGLPGEEGAP